MANTTSTQSSDQEAEKIPQDILDKQTVKTEPTPAEAVKLPEAVEQVVSQIETGVAKPELGAETKPEVMPEKAAEQAVAAPAPEKAAPQEVVAETAGVVPTAAAPVKTQVLQEIENILEEDLEDIYFSLPENKQDEFKAVGEVTASKINLMLQQAKIKIKKIIQLIIDWLKIIPGINRYFLEQEAKIKADRIMALKEKMNK